jgi:hypothetical protein
MGFCEYRRVRLCADPANRPSVLQTSMMHAFQLSLGCRGISISSKENYFGRAYRSDSVDPGSQSISD